VDSFKKKNIIFYSKQEKAMADNDEPQQPVVEQARMPQWIRFNSFQASPSSLTLFETFPFAGVSYEVDKLVLCRAEVGAEITRSEPLQKSEFYYDYQPDVFGMIFYKSIPVQTCVAVVPCFSATAEPCTHSDEKARLPQWYVEYECSVHVSKTDRAWGDWLQFSSKPRRESQVTTKFRVTRFEPFDPAAVNERTMQLLHDARISY
jgi:hypothetical protein